MAWTLGVYSVSVLILQEQCDQCDRGARPDHFSPFGSAGSGRLPNVIQDPFCLSLRGACGGILPSVYSTVIVIFPSLGGGGILPSVILGICVSPLRTGFGGSER